MRKTLLMIAGTIGLALGGLAPAQLAFAAGQLTIVSYGGSYQKALHSAVLEPFATSTGIKVTEDEFNGEIAKIRAMVKSKSVSWDVVDLAAGQAVQLCAEGTVETIDWKKLGQLGLDRSKLMNSDKYDCGMPYVISTSVIAYDKDKLPNGPKTIADFFDTQKFPGKRGLRKLPRGSLERALIADGVPVSDVYKVLSTPEGVDRAFKKLDTIKKDIVWWTAGAQPPQLLADGQVIMTTIYNSPVYDANKNSGKHFEIMWDAQLLETGIWAIPEGSPHRDDAYRFLAFAGSPQPQADMTRYVPYGPTHRDAIPLVDPAMLSYLPTAPNHMSNAFETDSAFWADKEDELGQRFTAWLAK
ncbi:ABC transporter substrate-binding protein [Bradyrhizobium sp. B124]|uniref:ABC transporter substrate-binding protein n=1 Tax=Bradyrhizobium sp. B124 TaxID=3140245 RepID=UPI003183B5A9